MTAMLTPGILDFIICISSHDMNHDINDGEGELLAAAASIIRMSIATTPRANGIGTNAPDPKDIGFVRRLVTRYWLAVLGSCP
jgi:hypothetical protein